MKELLHFEFRKLTRQKSFYICTAIMLGMLLMTAVLLNALQNFKMSEMDADGVSISVSMGESSTADFVLAALSNASFVTIVGIFAVLFVCTDHEQQTLKNMIARGYSRKNICRAKLIMLFAAATAMFVAVQLAALGIGASFFGMGKWSGKLFALLGVQYLAAMANVALAFMIASLIHKNGAAIAGVILLPSVVDLALSLADSYLKLEKLKLTRLWVSSFLSETTSLSAGTKHLVLYSVGSLAYIALFAAISVQFSKKNEL